MSLNEVSGINFATVGSNPQAQISIDNTGDLLLSPASGAAVLFNNLSLSGTSSSDPTATITADASGDILLTPASATYSICPSASSNMTIGSSTTSNLNSFNLYSGGNIFLESPVIELYGTNTTIVATGTLELNSLKVNASATPIISTTSTTDLYIGGSTIANTTCTNIGICSTDTVSLNYLQVNAESSPTISTSSTSDSLTLSANTLKFTPSAGFLRMSNTPYFTGGGTGAPQEFSLPCGGVFLLSMVANSTSGDQVDYPSISDMWYVFSTATSNTISPYSTTVVSGYYEGINANGVIGVESYSTTNKIGVAVVDNDGYYYSFFLTMIS